MRRVFTIAFLASLMVGCGRPTIGAPPQMEEWKADTSYDQLFPFEYPTLLGVLVLKDFATDPDEHREYYVAFRETQSLTDSSERFIDAVVKVPIAPVRLQQGSGIMLERWSVSETHCPAIRSAVESFRAIELPEFAESPDETVYVHPWIYEVYFRNGSNETWIKLRGPNHAISKWADTVRESLKACLDEANDAT